MVALCMFEVVKKAIKRESADCTILLLFVVDLAIPMRPTSCGQAPETPYLAPNLAETYW